MGGAGRQAHKPRKQIPQNGTDQAGKNKLRRYCHGVLVDEAARDGLCHLDRQKCADQVERAGGENGSPRLQRAGGDRRCHGVGRIVKAVRKVEDERDDDDEPDDYESS